MMSDYFQLPKNFEIKSPEGNIYKVTNTSSPDADLDCYKTEEGYHVNYYPSERKFSVLDRKLGENVQCDLVTP